MAGFKTIMIYTVYINLSIRISVKELVGKYGRIIQQCLLEPEFNVESLVTNSLTNVQEKRVSQCNVY